MKTIRNGVFETNSSSSHSISIGPYEEVQSLRWESVFEIEEGKAILYPGKLSTHVKYLGEASQTRCETLFDKLAMVVNWLQGLRDDSWLTLDEFDIAILRIKEDFELDDIVFSTYSDYYPYSEYGDNPFSREENFQEDFEGLLKVVRDNTQVIIDEDIPN
jgi:hypothetical protein